MRQTTQDLRLIALQLKNFKGIKVFTFNADGESVDMFGQNESGKTTLFDAMTWLLTDKDSRDRSPDSFGIKTRDGDGEVMHGLDHEVTGTFEVQAEGETTEVVLQKTYKEKWTSKRGSSTESFSGHTTDHHIDGVPLNAGEYQEQVDDIIPVELLKILTVPDYVPGQMHWKERRAILFDLAGDIKDEDVIQSDEELLRYPAVLDGKTHGQREKMLKAQKKNLNEDIDNIPDRIDEVSRMIEQVDGVQEANQTAEKLKEKKQAIEAKRSQVQSGGRVAELKVEMQELEAKKARLSNAHQKTCEQALADIRAKVADRQDKVDEIENDFREAERAYKQAESNMEDLESKKGIVADKLETAKARKPKEDTGEDVCPMCERPLETEDDHSYQDYVEEFNAGKAENIKALKEQLESVAARLIEAGASRDSVKDKAVNIKGRLSQRRQALAKARAELKAQKEHQPAFKHTDEAAHVDEKIASIEGLLAAHKEDKQEQLTKLNEAIDGLNENINAAEQTIHQAAQNGKHQQRIAELTAKRKDLAGQLEQVEADIFLMEAFTRARCDHVTDKVNAKFECVSWKLFSNQINGGLTETADAVYKGVPYGEGLNNAGQIQAGLDIINTLSKHYGKSAPVWIDNCEAITSVPCLEEQQIIRLYVSAKDKELRVETNQQLQTA